MLEYIQLNMILTMFFDDWQRLFPFVGPVNRFYDYFIFDMTFQNKTLLYLEYSIQMAVLPI